MRKRYWPVLAVVLCAVAGLLLFLELRRPEPIFRGKPLSVWIKDAPSPGAYEGGFADLLQQRSSEMLPYLIHGLKTRDNPLWKPYVWAGRHAPGFVAERLPIWIQPELMRSGSAQWLGVMGPAAREAAPVLRETVRSDAKQGVRCQAVFALVRVGVDSNDVSVLVRALSSDPSSQVRAAAAGALEINAPNGAEAIPSLVMGLGDRDAVVRQVSAAALGKYGALAQEAVPALERLAANKDEQAADYALNALNTIKSPAR